MLDYPISRTAIVPLRKKTSKCAEKYVLYTAPVTFYPEQTDEI
jgi:hypothetical protein